MKLKYFIPVFAFFALLIVASCKKSSSGEDPHNHSLLDKSLDDIRAEIAGKWQIQRTHSYVCGIIAPCENKDTFYINNTGDLVYFLTNDTVKQTGSTGSPIKIYEKATITKVFTYGTSTVDSVYNFQMANGLYIWAMDQIKNDTLVIDAGIYTHYLTRKP
jgi:hypothetical protein